MKKFILSALMLFSICTLSAKKSYVTVCAFNTSTYIRLSGNIPNDMLDTYDPADIPSANKSSNYGTNSVGYVLNLLSDRGFSVEQQSFATFNTNGSTTYNVSVLYLLSKEETESNASAIRDIHLDITEEIHEVARYNLQGAPVTEDEKGIQIVVYSNYTTKTVINE